MLTSPQLVRGFIPRSILQPFFIPWLVITPFSGVHGGVEESGNPTETKPVPQSPVLPIGPIPDGALPPHMIETGEAGAPGIMISSKPPKGADGSMTPIKGFAGAPGEI